MSITKVIEEIVSNIQVSWTWKHVSSSDITSEESDCYEKKQGKLSDFLESFWGHDNWGHFITIELDPVELTINDKKFILSGLNDSLRLDPVL